MKKKGLTLQAVESMPTAPQYLNQEDGKVVSQHGSIIFSENGLQGAKIGYTLGQLKAERELGRGSFGSVSLVVAPDGQKYALKEIALTSDAATQKNIYRELHSYIDYQHPFIVDTLNLYSDKTNKIFVLQELAAFGSTDKLYKRLKSGHINENGVGMIAIDTIRALEHVHKKNIIHRDIKPANLLMTEDGRCKLADFGVATSILQCDSQQADKTFAGSISYMAPERFKNNYSYPSDVWSLGITFIELLTGKFPFQQFSEFFSAMKVIADGQPPYLTTEMGFSSDCVNLINAMIEKDPSKRATCGQLLQMPFCKKYLAKEKEIRVIFAKWLKDNFVQ